MINSDALPEGLKTILGMQHFAQVLLTGYLRLDVLLEKVHSSLRCSELPSHYGST